MELSTQTSEAGCDLPDLDTLRGLGLAEMSELDLGILERQKLEAFCQTPLVQQLQQVAMTELQRQAAFLSCPPVLTEPQRQDRNRQAKEKEMGDCL